jgi:AcrR family transcriptional regulator
MKDRTRLAPKTRKADLLNAALKLAVKHGYQNVTRQQVAEAIDVSCSLISHHFGTMTQFRRALMRHAVTVGNATVVKQGIADGNAQALKAPVELRQRAIAQMMV